MNYAQPTAQVKQEEPYTQPTTQHMTIPQPPAPGMSYGNVIPKQEVKSEVQNVVYKPQNAVVQRRDHRSRKKSTKNGLDRGLFFKTKICPFLLAGHCSKRDRCTYAHSQFELRDAPNLKKTKICQLFLLGRCQMGLRCSYAHGEREMRSMDRFKVQTMTLGPDFRETQNDVARFYRDMTQGTQGGFRFHGNSNIGYSTTMINPLLAAQNQFMGMGMPGMGMMNMNNMQVKMEQNQVKQEQTNVLQPSNVQNQPVQAQIGQEGQKIEKGVEQAQTAENDQNKENVNLQMLQKQQPVVVNPAGQKALDSFTMSVNIDSLIK